MEKDSETKDSKGHRSRNQSERRKYEENKTSKGTRIPNERISGPEGVIRNHEIEGD